MRVRGSRVPSPSPKVQSDGLPNPAGQRPVDEGVAVNRAAVRRGMAWESERDVYARRRVLAGYSWVKTTKCSAAIDAATRDCGARLSQGEREAEGRRASLPCAGHVDRLGPSENEAEKQADSATET